MFFKRILQSYFNTRAYLDYASSTPLDHKMLRSIPEIDASYAGANPSALHREGVAIKRVLSTARDLVAKSIGAHADEIIFTSNATESDNLALRGFILNAISQGVSPESIAVYVSPFEHAAVVESVANLDQRVLICELVQEDGYVLENTITIPKEVNTVIVSVMYVQNELGTLQPIKEIAKRIRRLRKENPEKTIIFHVDATQAPLYYDLNVARLGVDMMTLGATKLYCPKGVGVLFKRRSVKLSPIIYGGGQEFGLRPGTEPVDTIHKFAHALSFAQTNFEEANRDTTILRDYFEYKLKEVLPNLRITGKEARSPHISHVVVPDFDSELLVIELDAKGFALSSKSACKNDLPSQTADAGESKLLEILYPHENVGAIRVSYGRMTTKKQLDRLVKALVVIMRKYSKK